MSPRLSRRRTVIAVASAAAVIGATLFTGTATAATSAEPVSTAVPIVTPDGMLMSYIGYPKRGAYEPYACGTGDLPVRYRVIP